MIENVRYQYWKKGKTRIVLICLSTTRSTESTSHACSIYYDYDICVDLTTTLFTQLYHHNNLLQLARTHTYISTHLVVRNDLPLVALGANPLA